MPDDRDKWFRYHVIAGLLDVDQADLTDPVITDWLTLGLCLTGYDDHYAKRAAQIAEDFRAEYWLQITAGEILNQPEDCTNERTERD